MTTLTSHVPYSYQGDKMHESVQAWVRETLEAHPSWVKGRNVIEVGSYNCNGSIRPIVEASGSSSYNGIDMREGPGVDYVLDAADLKERSCSFLICCEVLEHAEHWQAVLTGMVRALTPGAWLMITARGEGFPMHGFPDDYWRFTPLIMSQALNAAGLKGTNVTLDPQVAHPGVFAYGRKPTGWTDDVEREYPEALSI